MVNETSNLTIFFFRGNPASNIHRFIVLLSDKHQLVTSDYAHEEAKRNIQAKRAQWYSTFSDIETKILRLPSAPLTYNIELVEKDRPILDAVIAHQCNYLLTGDKKDFGHLYGKKIGGVTVGDYVILVEVVLFE